MKALVTGGAGFIGSNLVDRLIEENYEVFIIDNLSTGFEKNINKSAFFYNNDIRDENAIIEIFQNEKFDYVFHFAAQIDVRLSITEPLKDSSINILGTLNLLESSIKAGVRKFIYSNTGGALYGEVPFEDIPISENYRIIPECHYGVSKYTVELFLNLYNRLYGLNFTSLRFPNVYGDRQNPQGEAGVVAIFIGKLLKNIRPIIYGDGNQTRDYIYVKDVVNGAIKSIHKGNNQCINLGSGIETSVNDLMKTIKEISNINIDPIYEEKRKGEIERIALDASKALLELDWKPEYSLKDGIYNTYNYFKDHLNK